MLADNKLAGLPLWMLTSEDVGWVPAYPARSVVMYLHQQRRQDSETQELRRAAGRWLRALREARGISQRELAERVGTEYYSFISQLETGRGRIPPDRYRVWAEALGIPPAVFVRDLMGYYDPVTHAILFGDDATAPTA
jgi:hypothetical protein